MRPATNPHNPHNLYHIYHLLSPEGKVAGEALRCQCAIAASAQTQGPIHEEAAPAQAFAAARPGVCQAYLAQAFAQRGVWLFVHMYGVVVCTHVRGVLVCLHLM